MRAYRRAWEGVDMTISWRPARTGLRAHLAGKGNTHGLVLWLHACGQVEGSRDANTPPTDDGSCDACEGVGAWALLYVRVENGQVTVHPTTPFGDSPTGRLRRYMPGDPPGRYLVPSTAGCCEAGVVAHPGPCPHHGEHETPANVVLGEG